MLTYLNRVLTLIRQTGAERPRVLTPELPHYSRDEPKSGPCSGPRFPNAPTIGTAGYVNKIVLAIPSHLRTILPAMPSRH